MSAVSHFSLTLPLHSHYRTSYSHQECLKAWNPGANATKMLWRFGQTYSRDNGHMYKWVSQYHLNIRDDYILAFWHKVTSFVDACAVCGLRLWPDSVIFFGSQSSVWLWTESQSGLNCPDPPPTSSSSLKFDKEKRSSRMLDVVFDQKRNIFINWFFYA